MGLNEQKSEWMWRNGEWVRWEDATVHVTAHALHYGSSVFEGIRAYATPDGPAVFRETWRSSARVKTSCSSPSIETGCDPTVW